MAAFAVISTADQNGLKSAVETAYAGAVQTVTGSVWLVKDAGVTTEGVCKKLGVGPDGIRSAIVLKISSYFGMAPPNVWEWLSSAGSD